MTAKGIFLTFFLKFGMIKFKNNNLTFKDSQKKMNFKSFPNKYSFSK